MKIKEVADKFGVTTNTLRYWESIGVIPLASRNESGYRDYDNDIMKWIEFTVCMKKSGIPLDDLKEYRILCDQGNISSITKRKSILKKQVDKLNYEKEQIDNTLEFLTYKIKNYEKFNQTFHN